MAPLLAILFATMAVASWRGRTVREFRLTVWFKVLVVGAVATLITLSFGLLGLFAGLAWIVLATLLSALSFAAGASLRLMFRRAV